MRYCGICGRRRVKGSKGDEFRLTKCPTCNKWFCKECGSTHCQDCIAKEMTEPEYLRSLSKKAGRVFFTALFLLALAFASFSLPAHALEATDLIHCWSLDSGYNVPAVIDHFNSSWNLTNTGALDISGKVNGGLDFELDDSDSANSSQIIVTHGTDERTLSVWAKSETLGADYAIDGNIMHLGNYGGFLVLDSGTDTVYGKMKIGGVGTQCDADAVLDTNWHHYVLRYNTTELSLWIDGVKQADTEAGAGNLDDDVGANDYITLSREADGDLRYWDGIIDEVKVWDRGLTDAEIVEDYNAGNGYSCLELLPPDIYGYNLTLPSSFGDSDLDTGSLPGVATFIFLLFAVVFLIWMGEVSCIPALRILAGLAVGFFGLMIGWKISMVIGVFFVICGLFYTIGRGLMS